MINTTRTIRTTPTRNDDDAPGPAGVAARRPRNRRRHSAIVLAWRIDPAGLVAQRRVDR